jgi:hypothetical protein
MSHISKDIKDLLKRDTKTVTVNKWIYKLCIFLALLGLVAIVVGAVNSCTDPKTSVVEAK